MPDFPSYRGELPACLNPLKLYHYFLLAYWVFFRPTALKCYLYQANSELYKNSARLAIFYNLRIHAYRNLYLILLISAFFFRLLLTAPFLVIDIFILDIPVDIFYWLFNMALSVALIMVFSIVIGGVLVSVLGGVVFSATFGVVLFGILAGNMAFSVLAENMVFGVAFGVAVGVLGGVALGVTLGMALGTLGTLFGASVAEIVGIDLGVSRIIFYPIQFVLSLISPLGKVKHPLLWDEFIIFPLLNTCKVLNQALQQDEQQGIRQLAEVMSNPFQRWIMQKILYNYLHQQQQPLHFTYHKILNDTYLNTYIFAPVEHKSWQQIPNYHQLLLGEVAGQKVNTYLVGEGLVWWLTKNFRKQHSTHLTQFAALFYALYQQKQENPADILNQAWAQAAYTNIKHYPNGQEISQSFAAFTSFLNYETIDDLTNANKITANLSDANKAIRPEVIITLKRLGEIGIKILNYQKETSRVNKFATLADTSYNLDLTIKYIDREINEPERVILQTIIKKWKPLISAEGWQLSRFQITKPITNPYIAGNPVTGSLFVGRDDILRRLEELWTTEQPPSVILYGHRRMGKTSILQNLGTRFSNHLHIVDFNMQRVGFVKDTSTLLHNLALACYDSLTPIQQTALGKPAKADFPLDDAYTAFDRFLKHLDKQRQNTRFLVTVDEFELIEKGINEDRFEPHLLDFWRATIQTYHWFIMAFVGLHTLEEMRHDYWHPLFGSITAIRVSFLTHGAARQLITQPNPDFPIDYDSDAIEDIINLTYGQAYLVQLICQSLVARFNRQTFEEGVEREQRFTQPDVQAVIDSQEFFHQGNAYFAGIWGQAETADNAQHSILKTLSLSTNGLTETELAAQTQLSNNVLNEALKVLKRHDVLKKPEDKFVYTVALMQRWVREIVAQRKEDGDE